MRPFSVDFQTRAFGDARLLPDVEYNVVDYSWRAIGGPDLARIEVRGNEREIWDVRRLLRMPITIRDWQNNPVWWGYVHELKLHANAVTVGLSLDDMYNHVAVRFTVYNNDGGQSELTATVSDTDSASEYGTKQMVDSRGEMGTEEAVALAARILSQASWPVQTVSPGDNRGVYATIEARGWWHTLDWQLLSRSAGGTSHSGSENLLVHDIGNSSRRVRVAQSFTMPVTSTIKRAVIKIRTKGTPTDNVVVQIRTDNAGVPSDTVLLEKSIAASSISNVMDWFGVDFPTITTLTGGATYWLVIGRSGGNDGVNYYATSIDGNAGYSGGTALRFYDPNWVGADPAGDFEFEIRPVEELSAQINYALTNAAQFIQGVQIHNTSGIYASVYFSGNHTTLREVEQMLEVGTTNGRRLLAEVGLDRWVRIYEEAARPTSTPKWMMKSDGKVKTFLGDEDATHRCPVGNWCELVDAPPLMDVNTMENACIFFVERAEYSPADSRLSVEPRQARAAFDIGFKLEG